MSNPTVTTFVVLALAVSSIINTLSIIQLRKQVHALEARLMKAVP